MAIFRNIQMSFWTDSDIVDNYTPEDKLFYLYILTNPHTNLCGCYEISVRQMVYEVGYSEKKINELLTRATDVHKSVCYSPDTKELLIPKWSKYNWTSSEKFRKPLLKEIQNVKNPDFKAFLEDIYNGMDTVSIPYVYRSDTTDTDIYKYIYKNKSKGISDKVDITPEIIKYLNTKCNTNYKPDSASTKKHISARLSEGYTLEDFQTVIDKKCNEWLGTDMEKYLRPETLFGNKFESYLNQKMMQKTQTVKKNQFSNFDQRQYDYDELERELLQRTYGGGT